MANKANTHSTAVACCDSLQTGIDKLRLNLSPRDKDEVLTQMQISLDAMKETMDTLPYIASVLRERVLICADLLYTKPNTEEQP